LLLFLGYCFFSLDELCLFSDFLLFGVDDNNLLTCGLLGCFQLGQEVSELYFKDTDLSLGIS